MNGAHNGTLGPNSDGSQERGTVSSGTPSGPRPDAAQLYKPDANRSSDPPTSLYTPTKKSTPVHRTRQPSNMASWLSRHWRNLTINYHILLVFLLLTGAIVTAGIIVIKEVADKDERIQRLANKLSAQSVASDTMGVQMTVMATLASVAAGIIKDPPLTTFSSDFYPIVSTLAGTIMKGLAGRRASAGAGDPLNETIYADIYKTVVALPLIESIFMAPNGIASHVWSNPASALNNESSPLMYQGAVLYDNPIWRAALDQAALRRATATGDVHTVNGYHMAPSFFPIYIPNSLESTTFIPGVPEYPYCNEVTVCYSNTTKEKLWGWVGLMMSNDHIFSVSPFSADLLNDGATLSGTYSPRPLAFSVLPNITKIAAPYINSPNVTAGPYKVSVLMTRGLLWQFDIILRPRTRPHVAWRGWLYAAVALVGLGMGLMYMSMAVTRAGFRNLLGSVLPPHVVDPMVKGHRVLDTYENVTVMVLQLSSFQALDDNASVADIVSILDEVFSMFDRLLERYGGRLTKLYQLGDCFMVCANCPPQPDPADEAAVLLSYALDAQTVSREFRTSSGVSVAIRIACNSGHCIGACLGYLKPSFTLLSPTINDTLQLQGAVPPGTIVVTQATATLLYSTGRKVPFELYATRLTLPEAGIVDVYTVHRDLQWADARANTQPGDASTLADFGVTINPMGYDDRADEDQASVPNLPPVRIAATREDILMGRGTTQPNPPFKSVEEYTQISARNPLRMRPDVRFVNLIKS